MWLDPLFSAPFLVQLHVLAVLPSVVLGGWLIVISGKGLRPHRRIGQIYIALMTVTSATALGIQEINPGGFSWIHVLIPVTLFGLFGGLVAARAGRTVAHRNAMVAVYIGGILIAGGFALSPGRILHTVVFGPPI